jgi:hypothetical protein
MREWCDVLEILRAAGADGMTKRGAQRWVMRVWCETFYKLHDLRGE